MLRWRLSGARCGGHIERGCCNREGRHCDDWAVNGGINGKKGGWKDFRSHAGDKAAKGGFRDAEVGGPARISAQHGGPTDVFAF